MPDFLAPEITEAALKQMGSLALAHVGDAVYELLVRTRLSLGGGRVRGLHAAAVAFVKAAAQAQAAQKIQPLLTDEEAAVFRRARNAKVNTVPKNASIEDYHEATGLEALFGYLYLKGERARINELFAIITEE